MIKPKEDPTIRVKKTRELKFKDKEGRNYLKINFARDFGFVPETIIIEKVAGRTNCFVLMAVLTPEEIEREDKELLAKKADLEAKLDLLNNDKEVAKEIIKPSEGIVETQSEAEVAKK